MAKANHSFSFLAFTVFMILLIFAMTYAIGYVIYRLVSFAGFETSINLPIAARLGGLLLIAVGLVVGLDVMRYRRPLDVLVSTGDTFMKLLGRGPIGQMARRTEPFIPKGPYVYVRNPMYFTVLAFLFGLGLANLSSLTLLWGVVHTCWFSLVEIPFEESELKALFGESYASYKRQVPMLLPYGKKYKAITSSS